MGTRNNKRAIKVSRSSRKQTIANCKQCKGKPKVKLGSVDNFKVKFCEDCMEVVDYKPKDS